MIWKILGIEKTKDETLIKEAYHKKLRFVNPEDDAEGFKELRGAYDEAIAYANMEEEEESLEQAQFQGKKNEVDRWIDRVDQIYINVSRRRDVKLWEEILRDPVCDDLDTELEAAEKLLVYFMSHSYLPQTIWKVVEQRFHYEDNRKQLAERFPEDYLDYVFWQIHHEDFIDYELFEGKLDDKVDEYISNLYGAHRAYGNHDLEEAKKLLEKIERFDISHPYGKVEEARVLLSENHFPEALEIMEDLDFSYSDNVFIERIYAEALLANKKIEKAENVFESILADNPEDYSASLGMARCTVAKNQYEIAKEMVEDILENYVQDPDCMQLLSEINDHLVVGYLEKWEQEKDRETAFKLGWCYYQQRDFEKGIQLLDSIEEDLTEYDYINLRCRLYLANEDYELAMPLTKIWLTLIEEAVEDGTKEMTKRRNRRSLAFFSIGICLYEDALKRQKALRNSEKLVVSKNPFEEDFQEAEGMIRKGIETEENVIVCLSYMEQLAKYYIATKQYEACVTICNEIIEKDRGFFPAYVHRQRANYEMKNAKEVIDDFFACKDIYAGYSVPYVLAAEVFTAFEQYEDVENVLEDAKNAGLESDGLELYRVKCVHYKNYSNENVRIALDMLDTLIAKVEAKTQEDNCDIESMSELYREQVILLWDLDKTSEALRAVDKAIAKVDDPEELMYLKVDILYREGKLEEARKVCQNLIDKDRNHLGYQIKLGNIYERMDRIQDAIDQYDAVLRVNENSVPAIRRLMFIYSYLSNQKNDLELCRKGIAYATKLIEQTQSSEAYVERGNLYIDLYELEKAVEDCKEAIALDSDAYYAYNNLGCALLKLRRIDEAIEPLLKVIEMEPEKDHLPYLNLADCYRIQGKYQLAIQIYIKIIEMKESRNLSVASAQDDLAELYCLNQEYDKAFEVYGNDIRELEKNIGFLKFRLEPNQVARLIKCYSETAEIHDRMHNFKLAEEMYKKIEKLFYQHGDYESCEEIENMARYYRDQGDFTRARKVIERLIEQEDKWNARRKESLFVLASILYNNGQSMEAKEVALQARKMYFAAYGGEDRLTVDKRYIPARLYCVSMLALYEGNLSLAKDYISKIRECQLCVICESCDCYEYYYTMGMIYMAENNRSEAKVCFEKAIEISPYYPESEYQLSRIRKN